MKQNRISLFLFFLAVVLALPIFKRTTFLPFLIPFVFAHCDTLNGPVIQAAREALETRNVNLVLIWVKEKDEEKIKKAFGEAQEARKDPAAKEAADMRFFEELVRIHREAEGAPYTGIKTAGAEIEPGIEAADKAIEAGSDEGLIKEVSEALSSGIRSRFSRVVETKKHMRKSVAAGREYVEAYVEFIHYIEKLHLDISGTSGHHQE